MIALTRSPKVKKAREGPKDGWESIIVHFGVRPGAAADTREIVKYEEDAIRNSC